MPACLFVSSDGKSKFFIHSPPAKTKSKFGTARHIPIANRGFSPPLPYVQNQAFGKSPDAFQILKCSPRNQTNRNIFFPGPKMFRTRASERRKEEEEEELFLFSLSLLMRESSVCVCKSVFLPSLLPPPFLKTHLYPFSPLSPFFIKDSVHFHLNHPFLSSCFRSQPASDGEGGIGEIKKAAAAAVASSTAFTYEQQNARAHRKEQRFEKKKPNGSGDAI